MNGEIRVLMLEDTPSDAKLVELALRRAGVMFVAERVDTREGFVQALENFKPDIILADYKLPSFDGLAAVKIVRQTHPDIPVIMVSGALGDEGAVELLHAGAKDYVLKDHLARLGSAVQQALSIEQGIRARKAAEHALRESEKELQLFRKLLDSSSDTIEVLDPATLRFLDVNESACRDMGYSREELLSMGVADIDPAFSADLKKRIDEQMRKSGSVRFESTHRRKDGSTFPVEISSRLVEIDKTYVLSIARDITERKNAEKSLRESEARYKRITEGITDYQYTVRIENGRVVETTQSPSCETVTGYKTEEFAANPDLWLQMVIPEDRKLVTEHVRQVLDGNEVPPTEHRIIRKDGEHRCVSDTIIPLKDASGKLLSYDGVIRDITERKRAEAMLRDSEERNRQLFESSRDALMTLAPPSWKFTRANRATLELFGAASAAEYTALGPWNVSPEIQPDGRPSNEKAQEMIAMAMRKGSNFFEWEHQRLNGEPFAADVLLTRMEIGKEVFLQATVRDITDRKRAETELQRINRALRTIGTCNEILIHAADEPQLLNDMCRIIVEQAGYLLAWVGFAEHDEQNTVRLVAHVGYAEDSLERAKITWADNEHGRGPTGTAIRTQQPSVVQDAQTDPAYLPWRDNSIKLGYRSILALPLASLGQVLGALRSIHQKAMDSRSKKSGCSANLQTILPSASSLCVSANCRSWAQNA